MGSLDPLAAFALQAIANAQAAADEAVLNLGTLVEDLRAQVSIGDIVTATVLPPQNGVDRIQVLNQTVAAQLPPGIFPGESIALQVTGFTATSVLVRNLGPLENQTAATPPASNETAPSQTAPLPQSTTESPAPATPRQAAPTVAPAVPRTATPVSGGAVAPPREIFVAASVRQNVPVAPAAPNAAQPATPPELETRLAATRATPLLPRAPGTPLPPSSASSTSSTSSVPPSKPGDVALAVQRAVIERASNVRLPFAPARPDVAPAPPPIASARPTPEASLLARLQVPISATTLAAARIVETATRSLTAAFEKLDALLAKQPENETLVPLRSALSFVSRFDLRNAAALPEQIAAYVSNIVSSSESKFAQIVRALAASIEEESIANLPSSLSPAPEPGTALPAQAHATPPAQGSLAQAQPVVVTESLPATLAARAGERIVALQHDVKTILLALTGNPPANSSPQVVAALRDALTATTAVQLNALQSQNAEPSAITLVLPAYYHEHGAPAKLRISKDAGNGKNALDADNFHIAFVLDTASLGTVAIDLQTAGRTVSVDVKTETPRAAERFRSSLVDLRGRLEDLHYKIAAMGAGVAPRSSVVSPVTPAVPQPAPPKTPRSNVDAQA